MVTASLWRARSSSPRGGVVSAIVAKLSMRRIVAEVASVEGRVTAPSPSAAAVAPSTASTVKPVSSSLDATDVGGGPHSPYRAGTGLTGGGDLSTARSPYPGTTATAAEGTTPGSPTPAPPRRVGHSAKIVDGAIVNADINASGWRSRIAAGTDGYVLLIGGTYLGCTSGGRRGLRDIIGTALTAGTGIAVTVNDPGDTITVAVSGLTAGDGSRSRRNRSLRRRGPLGGHHGVHGIADTAALVLTSDCVSRRPHP